MSLPVTLSDLEYLDSPNFAGSFACRMTGHQPHPSGLAVVKRSI